MLNQLTSNHGSLCSLQASFPEYTEDDRLRTLIGNCFSLTACDLELDFSKVHFLPAPTNVQITNLLHGSKKLKV